MKVRFTRLEPAASIIEFPDPWGEGWRLLAYRYDSDEHREYLQNRRLDPVTEETLRRLAARSLEPKPAPAAEGEEPVPLDDFGAIYKQVARELLEAGTIGYADILGASRLVRELHLEEAEHLLFGWSGIPSDDGSEIPVSAESKRALLAYPDFVPPGGKHEGSTIGAALVAEVFERSRAAATQAAKVAELAEGNSEQPVAGVPSDGLN